MDLFYKRDLKIRTRPNWVAFNNSSYIWKWKENKKQKEEKEEHTPR